MKLEDKKTIEDVRKAMATLSIITPFTYPLLMVPLSIREDINDYLVTNGIAISVNPEMWKSLEFKQKLFVLMHVWLHIVAQHAKRMQSRKPDVWNTACDFAINDMIMNEMEGKFEPPEGIYYDPNLFYNKTAEDIYNTLLKMMENSSEQDQNDLIFDNYGENKFLNAQKAAQDLNKNTNKNNDLEQTPASADDKELVDAIIMAAARAKSMTRGFMPAFYDEFVELLKKTKVPWERVLLRYAKQTLKGRTDRNPFKPDPKYLPYDIIVPTEESLGAGTMVFVVDTSGSMDSKEFDEACGHIQKLSSVVTKCIVITADTCVHDIFRVRNIKKEIKEKKIRFRGRGGTDMHQAFKKAEEFKPDLIILFSDMEIGDFPPRPKKADVIFLATKESYIEEVPYGILVKIGNYEN